MVNRITSNTVKQEVPMQQNMSSMLENIPQVH